MPWQNIPGGTTEDYTTPALGLTDDKSKYRLAVTDALNNTYLTGDADAILKEHTIQYAIEITTDATAVTNTSYGIVDGVFRFITGRPGYNGVDPNYPQWEDLTQNTYQWFEGWLTKDGVGSPSRQVDIKVSGDYGTISGFTFTLQNTTKFWEYIEANDIYIVNRSVQLYAVIDEVFYKIWNGVIENDSYDETTYGIACIDSFKTLDKSIPNEFITNTNNTSDDASQGDPIPVVIGDVPYAKLIEITEKSKPLPLITQYSPVSGFAGRSYKLAPAETYQTDTDGHAAILHMIFDTATLYNLPDEEQPDYSLNALAGKYLHVVKGKDAPTDRLYKIKGNYEFGGLDEFTGTFTVRIQLYDQFDAVTPDEFNTGSLGYRYGRSSGIYNGAGEDTWWFEILDLTLSATTSMSSVYKYETDSGGRIKLFTWDKDELKFIQVTDYINYQEVLVDGKKTLQLLDSSISEETDVNFYTGIPLKNCRVYADFASPVPDAALGDNLLDLSRSTDEVALTFTFGVNPFKADTGKGYVDIKIYFEIDYDAVEDFEDWENFYAGLDFRYTCDRPTKVGWSMTLEDALKKNFRIAEPLEYYANDKVYAANTEHKINWIHNEVYRTGDDNNEDSDFTKVIISDPVFKTSDYLELDGDVSDTITNKDLTRRVLLTLRIQKTSTQNFSSLTVYLRQVSIFGQKALKARQGDLYARIKGQLFGTEETNNVYNAMRLLLETYSEIPTASIDYTNLSTTRNKWHCGRQITDRKAVSEYVRELAQQSFVCVYPLRDGKRALKAWRDDTGTAIDHTDDSIIRETIANYYRTDIKDLSNEFFIRYAFNPASKKFDRAFFITKIDQTSFPAATDTWETYFGGLPESHVAESSTYAEAKTLWDICHEAYDRAKTINLFNETLSKCYWYQDVSIYDDDSLMEYAGVGSSAYKFLENLVEWTSRQKFSVRYSLPLNSTNVTLELLQKIRFKDYIYTNDVYRTGWITGVEVDTKSDRLVITSTLEPFDIVKVADGIIEEVGIGYTDDTIDEVGQGNTSDTIDETGV